MIRGALLIAFTFLSVAARPAEPTLNGYADSAIRTAQAKVPAEVADPT